MLYEILYFFHVNDLNVLVLTHTLEQKTLVQSSSDKDRMAKQRMSTENFFLNILKSLREAVSSE